MQISGTLHLRCVSAEPATSARFDAETDLIETLSDEDIEALGAVIGAADQTELTRKIYRLAVASVDPERAISRWLLAKSSEEFMVCCMELAAYRRFMDALARDTETARQVADRIEREDRQALIRVLHDRFGGPPQEVLDAMASATERWTAAEEEPIAELIRAILDIACQRRRGELDHEAIGKALACVVSLRGGSARNDNGMVTEPITDSDTRITTLESSDRTGAASAERPGDESTHRAPSEKPSLSSNSQDTGEEDDA